MSTVDEGSQSGEEAAPGTAERETIVRIEGLSKRYEGVQALEDVTLDIQDNEVLALVGDNGAGKSTLIKCLTGVISPTAGRIFIRNEAGELAEHTIEDPSDAGEAGIETVFQDLALSGQHDVASNVFMGREPVEEGFMGRVMRRVDRPRMEREASAALAEIGFEVDPTAPTAELSGGQQQAVAVARALISDPDIVLLDEPTAEVSVEGSEKILELVGNLKSRGRTVVFISHNLEEVFEVADRIAVLRDGALVDVIENDGRVGRQDVVGLMTGAIQSLADIDTNGRTVTPDGDDAAEDSDEDTTAEASGDEGGGDGDGGDEADPDAED